MNKYLNFSKIQKILRDMHFHSGCNGFQALGKIEIGCSPPGVKYLSGERVIRKAFS